MSVSESDRAEQMALSVRSQQSSVALRFGSLHRKRRDVCPTPHRPARQGGFPICPKRLTAVDDSTRIVFTT